MDQETFEQIALNEDSIGDALKFVKENDICKVCSHNGSVFAIEPPLFVELEITDTEPGFKGDTATGATKRLAEKIAGVLKADIFEIEPVVKYTEEDLKWPSKLTV